MSAADSGTGTGEQRAAELQNHNRSRPPSPVASQSTPRQPCAGESTAAAVRRGFHRTGALHCESGLHRAWIPSASSAFQDQSVEICELRIFLVLFPLSYGPTLWCFCFQFCLLICSLFDFCLGLICSFSMWLTVGTAMASGDLGG